MNLGINLGLGSAAMMGRQRSPNDIRISGSRVCKLWSETCPAVGTTTPSVASVPALLANFVGGNLGIGTITGSPEQVRCTVDNSRHYVYHANPGNDVASWADIALTCVPVGSQRWIRIACNSASWANFDILNGVLGLTSASCSTSGFTGGVPILRRRTVTGTPSVVIDLLNDNVSGDTPPDYAGNVADGINVSSVSFTQIRASAQNNLARADDGSLVDPTGGVQTTIANQPLILDQNGNFYTGASGQIPVVAREAGRASFLSYVDPDILAVFDGDNPPLWCCGIAKGTLGFWLPVQANGAGIVRDCPLEIYGANLYSIRDDGVSGNGATLLEANGGTRFANWSTWAIIRLSNRVVEFWHQGAFINSVTLNAQATILHASVTTGHPTSITPNQQQLALMVGSGQLPGATAAARYVNLRPAMLALCARYPGLGLVA